MSDIPEDIKREAEWLCPLFVSGQSVHTVNTDTINAIAQAILAERNRANEDPDKYCMTDNGPLLWKEIAQGYLDELEWHRSSLNPKWKEVRENERERCAKIAEDMKPPFMFVDGQNAHFFQRQNRAMIKKVQDIADAIRG